MHPPEHAGRVRVRGVAPDEARLAALVVYEPDGVDILEDVRGVLEDEGGREGLDLRDLLLPPRPSLWRSQ